MKKILLALLAVGFLPSIYAQDVDGLAPKFSQTAKPVVFDRATLLEQAQIPTPVALPVVPAKVLALPEDALKRNEPITIRFSPLPQPKALNVRRISNNDGKLYLEVYSPEEKFTGAEVKIGKTTLKSPPLDGSLWLSLKPSIGKIEIHVLSTHGTIQQTVPTTLVEVRGRQIFLNGEPFLMKGATGSPPNAEIADYIHTIGFNSLRGKGSAIAGEQYGFMGHVSLNSINFPVDIFARATDKVFEKEAKKCLDNVLDENCIGAINNPYSLLLQLSNERSGAGSNPPGVSPVGQHHRRIAQMLVEARNLVKPLCPMLPVGYANQDFGFLTPDCYEVYMHNSYYDKDRFEYPWESFLKWQGCLPPDGPDGKGRPFINSEFGANRYIPQSYHGGPNNPILEKIHSWNLPQLWNIFMEQGTIGGAIYNLKDHDAPIDQGCSRFGILTDKLQVKLACWTVGQMWRDFTVETRGDNLVITYKRDYYARDCRLTITPVNGKPMRMTLKDFAPHTSQTISPKSLKLNDGYRWRIDFTTHSGLVNSAVSAFPETLAKQDFLARIQERETAPFLTELFDAEVLTVEGKPAPPALFDMTDSHGIIPVILHKPNGVTYLVPISRENPNTKNGQIKEDINLDIAFKGKVEKVDDMTGQPLPDAVDAVATEKGLRLTNIKASRIPGPIGARSDTPFMMPVYRITP